MNIEVKPSVRERTAFPAWITFALLASVVVTTPAFLILGGGFLFAWVLVAGQLQLAWSAIVLGALFQAFAWLLILTLATAVHMRRGGDLEVFLAQVASETAFGRYLVERFGRTK